MFTFLPQIYHKLNLLMLWWYKYMALIRTDKIFSLNGVNLGLGEFVVGISGYKEN